MGNYRAASRTAAVRHMGRVDTCEEMVRLDAHHRNFRQKATEKMSRLRHTLYLLMEFEIVRYLMCNADGREDGAEKALRHDNLCRIYLASVFGCSVDDARSLRGAEYDAVHERTQELTGYMDEVIGFPLKGRPDYDILQPKFFSSFVRLADEAIEVSTK